MSLFLDFCNHFHVWIAEKPSNVLLCTLSVVIWGFSWAMWRKHRRKTLILFSDNCRDSFKPHQSSTSGRFSKISYNLCACVLSHIWLCNPMDCSLPGSSVVGIFHARIQGWVASPSSRRPCQPRDGTHVSCVSCIGRRILYHCTTSEAHSYNTECETSDLGFSDLETKHQWPFPYSIKLKFCGLCYPLK